MRVCVLVCACRAQGVTFGPAETNQQLVVAACVLVGVCFVFYSLVLCVMVSLLYSSAGCVVKFVEKIDYLRMHEAANMSLRSFLFV